MKNSIGERAAMRRNGNGEGGKEIKVLQVPVRIKALVDAFVEWKTKEKEAKTEREGREAEIIEYIKPIQEEEGLSSRGLEYRKSYKVKGTNDREVTYVSSDRFSPIKEEDIPLLKNAMGEHFDVLVRKEVKVEMLPEVFTNPELQNELLSFIPPDKLDTFFKATTRFVVVDNFDSARFVLGRRGLKVVNDIVKQAKPALR